LADPALHRAALRCLAVALDRTPDSLRSEVRALAELVQRAECPGDRVLNTAREVGPAAAFVAATREGTDDDQGAR